MSVEQSVKWELAGETEVLGENLLQCHFVHHISHMTWPGIEPGPPRVCSLTTLSVLRLRSVGWQDELDIIGKEAVVA
jgi:hypothetical protein